MMEKGLACIGALVLLPAITVIFSVIDGMVLLVLWGWFIVPVFHAPQLTLLSAIGITLIMDFLTYHTTKGKEDRDTTTIVAAAIAEGLMRPAFILLLGWIVHSL